MSKDLKNRDLKRRFNVVKIVGDFEGTYNIDDALKLTENEGLDLVLVNDKSDPVICKAMDYTKHLYNKKKQQKKQTNSKQKELTFSSLCGSNDLKTKANNAKKFLSKKMNVKLTVQYKGRNIQHKQLGYDVLDEMLGYIGDYKMLITPKLKGNNLNCIIAPIK